VPITSTMTSLLNLKLAFRLSAIYLAVWVALFVIFPDLVAKESYSSVITPITQKLMSHIVFLWAAMIAIMWSLPVIADIKTQQTFAYYAGAFWLIGTVANAVNMNLMIADTGYLAVTRLLAEPALGLLFVATVVHDKKRTNVAS